MSGKGSEEEPGTQGLSKREAVGLMPWGEDTGVSAEK